MITFLIGLFILWLVIQLWLNSQRKKAAMGVVKTQVYADNYLKWKEKDKEILSDKVKNGQTLMQAYTEELLYIRQLETTIKNSGQTQQYGNFGQEYADVYCDTMRKALTDAYWELKGVSGH